MNEAPGPGETAFRLPAGADKSVHLYAAIESPQTPMSGSLATAVTVTACPTEGREVSAPPTLVVTEAIVGGCEPHAPTVSTIVAGALCRPFAVEATSWTV